MAPTSAIRHPGIILTAAVLLGGCASVPATPITDTSPAAECRRHLELEDRQVREHGRRDAQYHRLAGYAFLRSDRFLASVPPDSLDEDAFTLWVEALAALDQAARALERGNLPAGLSRSGPAECHRLLLASLRPGDAAALMEAAAVPDAYRDGYRALGLYPLTRHLVLRGVQRLHAAIRHQFSSAAATRGEQRIYAPATELPSAAAAELPDTVAGAKRDALGRPVLSTAQQRALLYAHAPVFEVDTVSDADRIGAPRWRSDGELSVDAQRPVVYQRFDYTRFAGQVLPQLSYIIWFPERTKQHPLDILGGFLDGMTWRVTLNENGRPLLADSMHNCGCYHMFFPSHTLTRRPPSGAEEPLLVPAYLPTLRAGQRLRLRLAAATHYLVGVDADGGEQAPTATYGLLPYDVLRSLPRPDGQRRSMFAGDGLVKGSERLERWLLWPMGVPSAGAMRQWGHHATAFVGKRHFDDADLMQRYFQRRR